ncbi:hypothetical protein JW887_06530 [Candidatus Dojkabacteria bacterium]|nr:hypothetical protein [Candidatus Dojkabacteria bacterium]
MLESGYTPKIEKAEALTNPIEAEAYVDQTSEFDFPFRLDQLPRLLSHSRDTENIRNVATRTLTEGRSYSYIPVVFKRNDTGTIYLDLCLKGGGSEIKPNVNLYENVSSRPGVLSYDPDAPIPSEVVADGKQVKVRYSSSPLVKFTSYLGVHTVEAGLSDKFMSERLETFGLRTRSMVAAWELPDDTQMATPEGLITKKDFTSKTNVEPGLELWAMRCKYRVQDLLRFVFEVEEPISDVDREHGMKLPFVAVYYKGGSHEYIEEKFSPDQEKILRAGFTFVAQEVCKRAKYDSDVRFVELSKRYKEINDNNLSDFYVDYLISFAQVLGEQFALMQNADAVSGLYTLQNISLLAEAVDHDVTMIGGKVMGKNGELEEVSEERRKRFKFDSKNRELNFFNQLYVGYNAIRLMLRDLNRTGIIDMQADQMRLFMKIYILSFAKHAKSMLDDLHRIASEQIQDDRKSWNWKCRWDWERERNRNRNRKRTG